MTFKDPKYVEKFTMTGYLKSGDKFDQNAVVIKEFNFSQ
jgi:hypothetical protein